MFLIRIGQKLIVPLMVIVIILLIIMLQMGFIFLLIALLPSIAAYFVDDEPDRITFRTIFACNLAATIPSITPVFISGLKMKHYDVNSMIASPNIWMFVYSGAAVGWFLVYFGKYLARTFLEVQYKLKISYLEKTQERLVDEWGDSLQPKPSGKK